VQKTAGSPEFAGISTVYQNVSRRCRSVGQGSSHGQRATGAASSA
jgi:hypothetical protein